MAVHRRNNILANRHPSLRKLVLCPRVIDNSSDQETQSVSYVYDAFNNLVGRTLTTYGENGATSVEHYVYDGTNMVLVLNGSGAVQGTVGPGGGSSAGQGVPLRRAACSGP